MQRKSDFTEPFVDGPIDGVIVRSLQTHSDDRGSLMELYRNDELPPENRPVMAYLSRTLPGATRGPHEHAEQSDYFVFLGPGEFTVYLWDARADSPSHGRRMKLVLDASNMQGVIIPPGVVHAYQNTGDSPAWIFNAPNQLYAGRQKRGPVDEIRYEGRQDSPYRMG